MTRLRWWIHRNGAFATYALILLFVAGLFVIAWLYAGDV